MTWGEFKKRVEELGINEKHDLRWIDVNGVAPAEDVEVAADKEGKVAIYT